MKVLLLVFLMSVSLFAQNTIEITVKGISDQQNNGAQQDRLEAILDARRQACEKAGLRIESKTTVENFQTVYDLVETQSASVLLPGFQLVEIGYVQDGTYQVVLSGKIKILDEEENISNKEMRYARSLKDRGKYPECEAILKKYIDSEDQQVAEELKQESFYYYIKWGFAFDLNEEVSKFAAYYPESKYVSGLESFAAFAVKPLYVYNRTFTSTAKDWKTADLVHNDITFTKKIEVIADTIRFKSFKGKDQSLLLKLNLYSDDEDEPNTAYQLSIVYYDGTIGTPHNESDLKPLEDRFRLFQKGGSPDFQHSSSGEAFADFKLTRFQIKGDVPAGKGPFEQNIQFEIYQKSF
jgi:hypothetical protein